MCNHPTGIADGIILHHLIAPLRPDLFVYANSDILRILPQMESMIIPVEWREEKRTRAKTRETMELTRTAIEAGRLGIIFPSGRLAKRRGLRLFERPWMPSAAMIARKFDLPVIPVNIRARNSILFYLFDLMHPTLRDITLFHETLNKDRQPYRVAIGAPILPDSAARPLRGRDRGAAAGDAAARRPLRADRVARRHDAAAGVRAQARRPLGGLSPRSLKSFHRVNAAGFRSEMRLPASKLVSPGAQRSAATAGFASQ